MTEIVVQGYAGADWRAPGPVRTGLLFVYADIDAGADDHLLFGVAQLQADGVAELGGTGVLITFDGGGRRSDTAKTSGLRGVRLRSAPRRTARH